MTDKRSIEGSAERAADRGRADDLGFSMGSKPNLGNAAVVQSLVSEFGTAVVNIRKKYNKDELSGDQAKAAVVDVAEEYGNIIMGRDTRYEALPWNSPARLGRRISLVVPALDGIADEGKLLFVTIGTSLMSIAAAHENGRLSDATAEKAVKDMLDDTISLILGLR